MNRSVEEFFGDEYKQQAQNANFTKISNIMGSKPTQNKVLNTLLLKNINTWTKVEVVSNITALETLYMGGSKNIDDVVIGMAASYTGSNNLTLIDTKGDFGARLDKTASASRYIFVRLGSDFEKYFNKTDLNVLPRYNFEGQDIEYQFLTYNLPLVLINGTEGMGSGHASRILPRNPDEVIKYLKYNLQGKNKTGKPFQNKPYYKGFTGTIEQGDAKNKWIIKGTIKKTSATTFDITEVPINENYKSYIKKLDKLVDMKKIRSYTDLCDPKKDIFLFTIKADRSFVQRPDDKILQDMKLIQKASENYTLIDENNRVKIYQSIDDIFQEYIKIKMKYLQLRKDYIIKDLNHKIRIMISKYLFIQSVNDGTIVLQKRPKQDIIQDLEKNPKILREDDYQYLLNMSIQSLTQDRMEKLMKDIKSEKEALDFTKASTIENMWLEDIK